MLQSREFTGKKYLEAVGPQLEVINGVLSGRPGSIMVNFATRSGRHNVVLCVADNGRRRLLTCDPESWQT